MRYFLWFLVSIGLIVLAIVLMVRGFHSGTSPVSTSPLVRYANSDTVMQVTVEGPLVSEQKHQGYRVTVGQTEAQIEALQGYEDTVTQTKTYANSQNGYANFLRALDLAGYQKGSTDPKKADSRGYCPGGAVYTFEIVNADGSTPEKFWATSCGGQGNFGGSVSKVLTLFEQQIPDFDTVTSNLNA